MHEKDEPTLACQWIDIVNYLISDMIYMIIILILTALLSEVCSSATFFHRSANGFFPTLARPLSISRDFYVTFDALSGSTFAIGPFDDNNAIFI